MKKNANQIILSEREMLILFNLCLNMEALEERASRCDALVDIFAEALESMHEKGIQPADGATYGRVTEVIREYSMTVKNESKDIHDKLSDLKDSLKND